MLKMLKSRLLFSSLLLSLLSSLTPYAAKAAIFLDWNPSLSELPPFEYDAIFFEEDPDTWKWDVSFSDEIANVFVAAPIHPIPYLPIEEYNGNHDNSTVSLEFFSPGVYTAKVDFSNPSIEDMIQFFYVDSSILNNQECSTCKPPQHSRTQKIDHPGTDVIILEQPNPEDKAIKDAADILEGEKRASSVDQAIQHIKDAFANKGNKPVSVKIVAHGSSDYISIGSGTGKPQAGKFLFDNDASVDKFIKELKGKISSLTLKACCVAKGVEKPGRNHLMERLADGLGVTVSGWDQEIVVVRNTPGKRDGYFGLDVHGKKLSAQSVPESTSTLSLLALGTFATASTLKHKLNASKSTNKKLEKAS
ncbi:hypothetical protein [Okeania sp. KiyG1]|uniref:hypothetical protein n=1 Tax=Okeania sp. KiyG1 TaxID=2720165 RepID=UPI001923308D|nr:hypothetical protein [Okeania sp. KiyG1]GGA58375.1 hypothetical protein CYANOKiyG1_79640 [Okeania sp. KiyG1]